MKSMQIMKNNHWAAYAFERSGEMKFREKVFGLLPELLDLPDQALPGVPIIEVYGDRRVLVEGCFVVLQYADNCIKLRNPSTIICVVGSGLHMVEISSSQTVITGKIENISICRG